MNLIGITRHGPQPHGFPSPSHFDLTRLDHGLAGWRVLVRGTSVFFVTPRGWRNGVDKSQWKEKDPPRSFQMPRASLTLHWEGEVEGLDKVDRADWPVVEEKAVKK